MKIPAEVSSINFIHKPVSKYIPDTATTKPIDNLWFVTMTINENFENLTTQMIRTCDYISQYTKKPSQNYEYIAA